MHQTTHTKFQFQILTHREHSTKSLNSLTHSREHTRPRNTVTHNTTPVHIPNSTQAQPHNTRTQAHDTVARLATQAHRDMNMGVCLIVWAWAT
jgi:hypothetical protein